jgi:transposase-like protein
VSKRTRPTYTPEQRTAALTTLEANRGNIKKTARETGITPPTLRAWRDEGKAEPSPEKAAALVDSFLEKVRRVREAAANRLLELIPTETDVHKVAGALKIANEAGRLEAGEPTEVSRVESVQRDLPERVARAAAEALKERGFLN